MTINFREHKKNKLIMLNGCRKKMITKLVLLRNMSILKLNLLLKLITIIRTKSNEMEKVAALLRLQSKRITITM